MTIQLDEAVIRRAKIAAARRHTSLSGLLAQQITKIADSDERYERAKQEALALMDEAARSGESAPSWTREELYDR
ncbi:hypothetical protein E1288_13260 [Saccharopolyspora elongata]|uniref:CopG family transcriptional regulator n=1 Tax=Saccharopolyspora elongata TaxID=2530387 RepID=A0A4R4Z721_9PSEU|nr:hypothetical protein E1288_13260 [Saccharopolyspora elongata]